MPKEARVALILTAVACLLAALADWVVEELTRETVVEELEIIVPAGPELADQAAGGFPG